MIDTKYKIVVCASCGGGLFKVLVENASANDLIVTKLIVNRECGAIDVAREYGIEVVKIPTIKNSNFINDFTSEISEDTNLIVLAGYLPILPSEICQQFERKIINVHPSLLPKYGGKGMYGVRVQEAVMANKEKYGGCTIHYVSKGIDEGDIIYQESVEIDYNLTPWEFGGIVFDLSASALIKTIKMLNNDSN